MKARDDQSLKAMYDQETRVFPAKEGGESELGELEGEAACGDMGGARSEGGQCGASGRQGPDSPAEARRARIWEMAGDPAGPWRTPSRGGRSLLPTAAHLLLLLPAY